MKKIAYLLFSFLFLFSLIFLLGTQKFSVNAQDNQDHIPGTVLVKFKSNTPQNVVDAEVRRSGARVVDKISVLDTLVLKVPESQEDKVVTALSRNPHVEYAELDYLAYAIGFPADTAPNDPNFADKQWGLENTGQEVVGQTGTVDADIDAPTAWKTTTGTSSTGAIKVAILDTGIDQNHEDLSTKIVLQANFTTSETLDDLYGHGTHVGGIAAAITNNSLGVSGGCPDCVLMNGKVLRDDGAGAYSWIANGIIWSANNGAKVINLSLGGTPSSKTLGNAVNYAWNEGSVVVAAAGNCGCQAKLYPAAYTNAIAVAATNNKDQKASFSSYGVKWVDVAAPGENIFSTFPNHEFIIQTKYGRSQNYDFGSGTSMATPMTSATAALIWSTSYGTSASNVRSRLETTADKIIGTGNWWSAGRINVGKAVSP